jgi:hypothetical protein
MLLFLPYFFARALLKKNVSNLLFYCIQFPPLSFAYLNRPNRGVLCRLNIFYNIDEATLSMS